MAPIEKAARALSMRVYETEEFWEECVGHVHIMLKAIREPSEAMVRFGHGHQKDGKGAIAIYQAMIDAAFVEAPNA